ncbi:MAG: hypothetical protein JOZ69_17360 [Myxococcales bacterium]|nr:hypothetical protein [Myxococcales bacterium]
MHIRALRDVMRLLTTCYLVLGAETEARATNSNPNLIPFGENESFLGNTGIGRASDTGAVFYNPAGLADIGQGRVSVSGAVYLSFNTHFDAITRADETNIPFDYSGFNTIPSTYVATRRVGDWVGALSVLVPNSLKLDDHSGFATPHVQGNLVYSISQSELWVGLSAARRLDPRWSVGLTLFGVEHDQTNVIGADAQSVDAPTTIFSTTFERESILNFGLLATLGASYQATDWLRLGARAQTALVQLYGKGQSFQIQRSLAGQASAQGEDVQGPANYGIPFDFGLGSALRATEWMTVLVDVSLQLGETYSTFPASTVANQTVTLVPTPRLNLGVELTPAPELPVRLGGYYVPSANGGHPGDADYDKEDFYGLTAGVGLNDEHVRTTVGGFYLWSTGSATPGNTTGTTAAVRSQGYGALLTTAYAF